MNDQSEARRGSKTDHNFFVSICFPHFLQKVECNVMLNCATLDPQLNAKLVG